MAITPKITTFTKAFKDNTRINTYAVFNKSEHDFNVRTDDIERWFEEWIVYHQKTLQRDDYRFKLLPENDQPILHSQS